MKNKSSIWGKYKFDIISVFTVVIIMSLFSFNFSILFIQGNSMNPTYKDKEILLLNKEKDNKNQDIIVFHPPGSWNHSEKRFIKRTIASEDDVLKITNDEIYVNNKVVANSSDKKCGLKENVELKIPKGKIFVMGDNYGASNDSLTQFCDGNNDFLVDEDNIIVNGKESLVIGVFSSE